MEKNTLLFTEWCGSGEGEKDFDDKCKIEKEPPVLSLEYLEKNAYNMGIRAAQKAFSTAKVHMELNDSWHPYISVDWGTGFTASMFSGKEVVFEEITSCTEGENLRNLQDFKANEYNPENKRTN